MLDSTPRILPLTFRGEILDRRQLVAALAAHPKVARKPRTLAAHPDHHLLYVAVRYLGEGSRKDSFVITQTPKRIHCGTNSLTLTISLPVTILDPSALRRATETLPPQSGTLSQEEAIFQLMQLPCNPTEFGFNLPTRIAA